MRSVKSFERSGQPRQATEAVVARSVRKINYHTIAGLCAPGARPCIWVRNEGLTPLGLNGLVMFQG